ncbi:MAG: hypothetical protein ACM3MF_03565 [Anaerolineae bacterium]
METTQEAIETTQPTARTKTRARLRGCLIGLIGVCLLVSVASGLVYLGDAFFDAPWAYPLFGRPTLTGTWEGEFTTPTGVQFAVFLNLRRDALANGAPSSQEFQGALLSGKASWCDNTGRTAPNIPVGGAVPVRTGANGKADRVEIDLESAIHPQPGLLPAMFKGKWEGDTLVLQPTFSYWDGKTFDYSSNNPDLNNKITVVLKKVKYGAFPQACSTLNGTPP